MRIGVLSDFVSSDYCCGTSLQSMFLAKSLRARGHEVLVIGPRPAHQEGNVDPNRWTFLAGPLPTFPGIRLALPWPPDRVRDLPHLDVIHAQLSSHFLHLGYLWRERHGTALVNTNTLHLPSYTHNAVPAFLQRRPSWAARRERLAISMEKTYIDLCNRCDEIVVQGPSLLQYWKDRGIEVPMTFVPRPVDPSRFPEEAPPDPFPARCPTGSRLLVCGRLDLEKHLDRLISTFDRLIASKHPSVTLTIVGTGPEASRLRDLARSADHGARIFFPGKVDPWALFAWYGHSDLFVHVSVSEVFGNVVNEAMWVGKPVVAFADNMGVSGQIVDGVDGILIDPVRGGDPEFAVAVLDLLTKPERAAALGRKAGESARARSSPDAVMGRLEAIYERAVRRVGVEDCRTGSGTWRHVVPWGLGIGGILAATHAGRTLGLVRGPDG